jgi:hypothetical protein
LCSVWHRNVRSTKELTIIVQHFKQAPTNAIEEAGFDSVECMELFIPSLLLSTHQPCLALLTTLSSALPVIDTCLNHFHLKSYVTTTVTATTSIHEDRAAPPVDASTM